MEKLTDYISIEKPKKDLKNESFLCNSGEPRFDGRRYNITFTTAQISTSTLARTEENFEAEMEAFKDWVNIISNEYIPEDRAYAFVNPLHKDSQVICLMF